MRVTNLQALDKVLKKIEALQKEKREYTDFRNDEIAKIDSWYEGVTAPIDNEIEYQESLAIDYLNELREETGKKTVSTPTGKVHSRVSRPSIKKVSDEPLLEYAIENNIEDALQTKLAWSALKKRLAIADGKVIDTETGEVIDRGVVVTPERVTYSVKVGDN